ncbi:MAG TPA: ATP-binding protein [Burkholderiales bacterium]|nr:ATP-binding protein [Burkholderiales bacterium]
MQVPDSQTPGSSKPGDATRADLGGGDIGILGRSGSFLRGLQRTLWQELTALSQVLSAQQSEQPASFWRSLFYFNLYRLAVACSFIFTAFFFGQSLFGTMDRPLFLWGSFVYGFFAVFFHFTITAQRPYFTLQLTCQVLADIVFLVILMDASGGITSGLGLLPLASLAAAGLISRGRLTLFYAALASIAVLMEQTFQVLRNLADTVQYIQAGMLSVGYFATAWLAHTLAKYTQASERLALQRGIDLANLAQVNQLVIQDMQDGVLVVDEKGTIRQHNSQAERLLGTLPRERKGMLLHEYAPALAQQLERWRNQPNAAIEPLAVSRARLIGARFLAVGDSYPLGTVIFLEDLSRVQAQAQQLKLAALGRLTANIAHEIRNPLSSISHAAELLQEESEHTETQARLLKIISDNAQRLDRMVQDVLKLNRRDRALRENIKLVNFLRTFVEEFCRNEKIPAHIFKLESHTQRGVFFDRSHLNQVMWNLCRNALRHCQRREGSIRLVAAGGGTSKDAVRLDIIDDGPGVPPALRSQLFEPFFTTATGGTGLGLYIAREICDANGATLDYVEATSGGHFTVICKAKA